MVLHQKGTTGSACPEAVDYTFARSLYPGHIQKVSVEAERLALAGGVLASDATVIPFQRTSSGYPISGYPSDASRPSTC